jgi:hypothetical protein
MLEGERGVLTIYLCPGPVYKWVTNASNTNIAVSNTASTTPKNIITGTLATILNSLFHHGKPGTYPARRFSTFAEPRVPHRTERMRSRMVHHSTKVIDQRRRRVV